MKIFRPMSKKRGFTVVTRFTTLYLMKISESEYKKSENMNQVFTQKGGFLSF